MKGYAGVYLRRNGAPLPPGCAGHVGWAFMLDDGSYYYGPTENQSGLPFVKPGDDNGWWGERGDTNYMLQAFRARNYDAYKVCSVLNANPSNAEKTARYKAGCGYGFITDNCLDHVWDILSAYGIEGLPWRQNYPSPNDWVAQFNGEFHNL